MENNIENLEKDVEALGEKLASTNKELRESKQVLDKTEIVSNTQENIILKLWELPKMMKKILGNW